MKTDWEFLDKRYSLDMLGLIPEFLSDDNSANARTQFDICYVAGWNPMKGFRLNKDSLVLTYPGDPPLRPIAKTKLREETIVFYPHAWVMILQPDGSFEVTRMD
jgi:hypothetical protein